MSNGSYGRTCVLVLGLVSFLTLAGCGDPIMDHGFPLLTGDFLGQPLPGTTAELFAPDLINTGMATRDLVMNPAGDEIYFCMISSRYNAQAILVSRRLGGRWSRPEVCSFTDHIDEPGIEPAISADGRRLFFCSTRPDGDQEAGDADIWVVDRQGDRWGKARNLGAPVNSDAPEYFPSLTQDGTLYFCRADPETRVHFIYRSRWVEGRYQEPERLPDEVNCGRNRFNAFIAPDESYIIVPAVGMPENHGGVDYYISFRDAQDRWTQPRNMGPEVNSAAVQEWSAFVSPDSRVLFFMSDRKYPDEPISQLDYAQMLDDHERSGGGNPAVYWLDAGIIEELRREAEAATPTVEVGHD